MSLRRIRIFVASIICLLVYSFSAQAEPLACPADTSTCLLATKGKLQVKAAKTLQAKMLVPNLNIIADLGDPHTTDQITACVKVDGNEVQSANLPTGTGVLRTNGSPSYQFKAGRDNVGGASANGSVNGIVRFRIKENGNILYRMDGSNLPTLALSPAANVEVVIAVSTGVCYKAEFAAPLDKDDESKAVAKF